ncbi:MAG: putative sulfate exporter family transporter [Leptolyngbya sp. PLA1]|nr:putative sulfate exporter family transporter [Leptolyngbya sp. PLA1]
MGEAPPKPAAPPWKTAIFLACALAAAGPWCRTDVALLSGMLLALLGWTAFPAHSKALSKWLIQACVVLLGLRIDLSQLLHAAGDGLGLAIGTIVGTLAMGLLLGALLRSGRDVSLLVSSGTAICGGSAIAAVGSAIGAAPTAMAVSTGAVFVLNAIGLWTLPQIGHALGLTDAQFGAWAGVALHDIASVGGAAKAYHPGDGTALEIATVVKLVRVVWIFPIALAAGWWWARTAKADPAAPGRGSRQPFPWFILGFVGASGLRTMIPALGDWAGSIAQISGVGFQLALFLIGAGLSVRALREVGWRALAQAAVLWVIVAATSLLAIRWTT